MNRLEGNQSNCDKKEGARQKQSKNQVGTLSQVTDWNWLLIDEMVFEWPHVSSAEIRWRFACVSECLSGRPQPHQDYGKLHLKHSIDCTHQIWLMRLTLPIRCHSQTSNQYHSIDFIFWFHLANARVNKSLNSMVICITISSENLFEPLNFNPYH